MLERVAPRHRATLALAGGWFVLFLPWLVDSGGIPYFRDAARLYLPVRAFFNSSIRAGHLPQWFPYESLGTPFIGQIVTATFHPLSWLLVPFSAPTALKLHLMAAILLGAAGAYRFARALAASRPAAVAAAVALACSGYTVSMHDNLPYLMTVITLPWVGWRAVRLAERAQWRDAGALAIAWALVFLGGDAQGTFFAGLLVGAALLARARTIRPWILSGVSAGLALGIMCVELLPATSVFHDTVRMTVHEVGGVASRVWALQPWRLPEILIPGIVSQDLVDFIGKYLLHTESEGAGGLWATTIFCGSIVVALFLAGIERRRSTLTFAGFSLLGLWLALGARGRLLPAAFHVLPLLGRFAYPEKYMSMVLVGLVPVVARGYDRTIENPRRFAAIGGTLALLAAVFAGAVHWFDLSGYAVHWSDGSIYIAGELNEQLRADWAGGALTTCGFLVAATALALLARRYSNMRPLIVLAAFLELWRWDGGQLPLAKRSILEDTNPFTAAVAADVVPGQPPPRVVSTGDPAGWGGGMLSAPDQWLLGLTEGLKPDIASLWRVGTIGEAMLPALSARLLDIARPEPSSWGPSLHACWRIGSPASTKPSDERRVASDWDRDVALFKTRCRDFAYAAGAHTVASYDAARDFIHNGPLPRGYVIWEGGPEIASTKAEVRVDHWQPGLMVLAVDAAASTAVVVSEATSPGWSATVDGAPTRIFPTVLMNQGVEVPAGRHTVELRYRTPHLVTGAMAALTALLLSLGLLLVPRKPS